VKPSVGAVLVAAGESRRMGTDKLWLDLFGRPAWRWSLDLFLALPSLARLALVVPADDDARERFAAALPSLSGDRVLLVSGGATRGGSVRAGLTALAAAGLAEDALVLVHDAARPALTGELVDRVLAAAADSAGVVPALLVAETLLGVEEGRVVPAVVDRSRVVGAQTPQLGRLGDLRRALAAGDFGDEASALAAAGVEVRVVAGEAANRKLTEPGDEALLRAILRGRAAPAVALDGGARAGIGFDAHRFAAGRSLRLGGLDFPDEPRGLAGHSVGDVLLNALIDALLGAAGAGDIGRLFPPDERWRDAESGELLRLAVQRVRAAGWRAVAVDLTVIGARPRIGPRAGEMAARIASLLEVDPAAVHVKATTSDGLGMTGEEGLAAYAVATVGPLG
jgi:2-C-methyl-D-erythritol 4-phosphate cytidylyltransferase/2-C-methyl-D-erythritol 2,4-cyclodiphosphate synthase